MKYTDEQLIRMGEALKYDKDGFDKEFSELINLKPILYEVFTSVTLQKKLHLHYVRPIVDYLINGEYKDYLDANFMYLLTNKLIARFGLKDPNPVIGIIELIFNPNSFTQEEYLSGFSDLISMCLTPPLFFDDTFKYKRFEKLYKIIQELWGRMTFSTKKYADSGQVVVGILAYCYLNDLYYDKVYEFHDNRDEYMDMLKINGINKHDVNQIFSFIPHLFKLKRKKIE